MVPASVFILWFSSLCTYVGRCTIAMKKPLLCPVWTPRFECTRRPLKECATSTIGERGTDEYVYRADCGNSHGLKRCSTELLVQVHVCVTYNVSSWTGDSKLK